MGSNRRAFPSHPTALLGAGQCWQSQRQQQQQQREQALALVLDLHPPSAAAGLRGKGPQGERVGHAHAPQAMDGHRRAPRRHADPRSGRCSRGRLSLVPFFADPKKGTRAAAAARNKGTWPSQSQSEILRDDKSQWQPHGTGQACDAARKNHRARASTTARSFAMLRMTTRGGRGTTRGNPVKRRERASKTPTRSVRQLNARARRARCSSSPGYTSANCPAAWV